MRTDQNVVIRYASGMLGDQVVARSWKGRPFLANRPKFSPDRKFSDAQISQQEKFMDAAAYAKGVMPLEETPEIYVNEAKSHNLTEYNVAMRDYLRPPNVRDIGIEGYTGQPGEEIVVRAVDDCEVVSVHVAITHDGEIVEEGDAYRDPLNTTLWRYSTTQENELPGTVIEAYATDMPGNVTAGVIEL
ncbi:MAG: hypothetical protein LN416_07255 [Candidatus Thermoplasmatota archaeon]|nr:hypothetical protein [Candidatus Thermoplasmatota archaeon]